ncbi:AMP-binding protein [Marinicrinis lubricantis]|uniref:AMP-binding protein n=1 Tax=Marinicrinis lubricantis TaxID=2086470 RepID=A0ABW1ILC4_9BACL
MSSSNIWLDHYPYEVKPTYEYPNQNVAQFLVDTAQRYPARHAAIFFDTSLTYEQLLDSAYRFANYLVDGCRFKAGDRMAIMLPNCPQMLISYFGTLLAGGIVVMTNPLYTEDELTHQLNDSEASYLVTLDLLTEKVLRVQPRTSLRKVVFTSLKEYLPFPKNILYPLKMRKEGIRLKKDYGPKTLPFSNMLWQSTPRAVIYEVNAEEDLALLQYTGGTTGTPKGVMLTHRNLISNTLQSVHWSYGAKPGEEVYLAALPCFHVFGLTVLLNKSVYTGGTLLLIPKFEPDVILETIRKYKPTIFPGAPTMYIALIHHPRIRKYDLSSINICISGSAPLPQEVQEQFEALTGGKLIEGYGLTEASPVTHANNIWEKRKNGTIGIPFPDTEAKVVHPETGEAVQIGEIGELVVKGPQIMKGYWKKPMETAKVLRDGWLFTGDLATMDKEGFFSIVDRKKDMIIAGGFNVYPREVEEVLYAHPAVLEAAVIGVPDAYRGETVKAFIVVQADHQADEQELDRWCRRKLAAYKVPRVYEFRDVLPKTMVGKVLKRALVEQKTQQQSDGG